MNTTDKNITGTVAFYADGHGGIISRFERNAACLPLTINSRVCIFLFQATIPNPDYKPEPRRVPLTKEDFDGMPVMWVRNRDRSFESMIGAITSKNVFLNNANQGVSYEELKEDGYQYSTDRVTWKPFWKEVSE